MKDNQNNCYRTFLSLLIENSLIIFLIPEFYNLHFYIKKNNFVQVDSQNAGDLEEKEKERKMKKKERKKKEKKKNIGTKE